jgi:hypothetical protein
VPLAHAATEEEWAAFRKDVEAKCLKATEAMFARKAEATVDPFGSERYGLALVRGRAATATAAGERPRIAVICVYDKQTRAVEIGGELILKDPD